MQLMEEARLGSLTDAQKYVVVVFDEIRVKEDLVYERHEQEIIGFVDLGNIPNQLRAMEGSEKLSKAKALQPDVATHASAKK